MLCLSSMDTSTRQDIQKSLWKIYKGKWNKLPRPGKEGKFSGSGLVANDKWPHKKKIK